MFRGSPGSRLDIGQVPGPVSGLLRARDVGEGHDGDRRHDHGALPGPGDAWDTWGDPRGVGVVESPTKPRPKYGWFMDGLWMLGFLCIFLLGLKNNCWIMNHGLLENPPAKLRCFPQLHTAKRLVRAFPRQPCLMKPEGNRKCNYAYMGHHMYGVYNPFPLPY